VHPELLAWELHLANHEGDDVRGEAIAKLLLKKQQPEGHWGLGTRWGKTWYDFKKRTADDAESWEVAEVGLALMDHHEATGSEAALTAASRAAEYLAERVVHIGKRVYLSHMPDCNNRLQAHSTIGGAVLLARFPKYGALAKRLVASGKAMKWRRIMPVNAANKKSMRKWRWYTPVNDYERAQVGFYLAQLDDPDGEQILRSLRNRSSKMSFYRKSPYMVMAESRLGNSGPAWTQAIRQVDFKPEMGYDWALRDWIDAVLGDQIRY
jgi:hypothetical protein